MKEMEEAGTELMEDPGQHDLNSTATWEISNAAMKRKFTGALPWE